MVKLNFSTFSCNPTWVPVTVNYWVEQMARDVDKAIEDENERRRDEALKNFMGHVLGYQSPKGDIWMDV